MKAGPKIESRPSSTARAIAEERQRYMAEFFERLNEEMKGPL